MRLGWGKSPLPDAVLNLDSTGLKFQQGGEGDQTLWKCVDHGGQPGVQKQARSSRPQYATGCPRREWV